MSPMANLPLRFLTLALLLLGILVGGSRANAQSSTPLDEAIQSGLVESEIVGRSSTYVQPLVSLTLRNLSNRDIDLAIPIGAILTDEADGRCTLVHLRSEPQHLGLPVPSASDSPPVVARLFAYCLDLVSPSSAVYPSTESRYRPTGEVVGVVVQQVLANIEAAGQEDSLGAQLSIWSAATGKDLAALESEMGANYALYQGQVSEFLGDAAPNSPNSPTADSATAVPTSGGTADGEPTQGTSAAAETDSTATPTTLLGAVSLILLMSGGALLLLSRHSRPQAANLSPTRSSPSPITGAATTPGPRVPTCIRCKQPVNAQKECVNPTCPDSISYRPGFNDKPDDTAPLGPQRDNLPPSAPPPSAIADPGKSSKPPSGGTAAPPWERECQRAHRAVSTTEPLPQQAPLRATIAPTDARAVQDRLPATDDAMELELKVLRGGKSGAVHLLRAQAGGLQGILSRAPIPQLSLPDTSISMPHAVVDMNHGGRGPHIRDLGSRNGTRVNNALVAQNRWTPLSNGAVVQLGKVKLRFDQGGQQLIEEATGGRILKIPTASNRCLLTRADIPFIDFTSDDTRISVPHVYIRLYRGLLEVWDLSSNGLKVQGQPVQGREPIFDGDEIEFGTQTAIQVSTSVEGIPEAIDGWKLDGMIGRGGMAYVYRARRGMGKGNLRALKIPQPSRYRQIGGWGETYRRLFRQEAELAGRLQSQHLVKVEREGTLGGVSFLQLPYLLMDYVDGPSLHALIEKQGNEPSTTFALVDAAEIAYQAALALQVVHEAGYIHCDVKPTNILVCHTGQVYLTDLGVATQVGQPYSELGVERYLPAEVIQKKIVAPTTDVFSLGQVLLDMLAPAPTASTAVGRDAGIGVASTDAVDRALRGPVARVGEVPDPDMQEVLRRCLSGPDQRYQSMDELLAALEPLRVGARLSDLVQHSGWQPLSG